MRPWPSPVRSRLAERRSRVCPTDNGSWSTTLDALRCPTFAEASPVPADVGKPVLASTNRCTRAAGAVRVQGCRWVSAPNRASTCSRRTS
jgi:hypothetical protein